MQNTPAAHEEPSNCHNANHVGNTPTSPSPIDHLPEEIRERICKFLAPLQNFHQRWKNHRWPGYSRLPSYPPFLTHYTSPQRDLRHLALTARSFATASKRYLSKNILIPDVPTMASLLASLSLSPQNARYVRSIQPLFRLNDGISDDQTLSIAFSLGRALPSLKRVRFPDVKHLQRYQQLLRPRTSSVRALGPLEQQDLVQTMFLVLICLTPRLRTLKVWIPPPDDEQYRYLLYSVTSMAANANTQDSDSLIPCPEPKEIQLEARILEVEIMAENFLPEHANAHKYGALLALGKVDSWDIHGLTGEFSREMDAYTRLDARNTCRTGMHSIRHLRLAGDVDAASISFEYLFYWFKEGAKSLRTLVVCGPFDSHIHPGVDGKDNWNTVLRCVAGMLETLEIPVVCCDAFRCAHASEGSLSIPRQYENPRRCSLRVHPLRFGPEKRLTHLSEFHNLSSLKLPLRALFGDFRTYEEGTTCVMENQDRLIAAVKWLDPPPNLVKLHLIEEHGNIGITVVDEDGIVTAGAGADCCSSLNTALIMEEFARECCPRLPVLRLVVFEPLRCRVKEWTTENAAMVASVFRKVDARLAFIVLLKRVFCDEESPGITGMYPSVTA
ncbi:hypothetical protein B0T19DRAFT_441080 [Cercophora scortea]|uniref:Uncharacterized protein n=1 Tax=Cercophora scortea TaxID=314031 RepID=A0AAE0ILC1_9PEZI|nr:hypothetical protein B0T19DRAFT_441080 [Cercophora scortea]